MLISIITVNYNDVKGLERTIKSVQEQSATNYEHIIIDGGSTDGSAALIEQYHYNL
jgi:glycosyltransferase involved in cell wall biosynthesis